MDKEKWIVEEYIQMQVQKQVNDVFGKIRAEIEAKIIRRPWLDFEDRERDRNDAFLEVLDILDKYKAESEVKTDE